jgi:hypothetical protein
MRFFYTIMLLVSILGFFGASYALILTEKSVAVFVETPLVTEQEVPVLDGEVPMLDVSDEVNDYIELGPVGYMEESITRSESEWD